MFVVYIYTHSDSFNKHLFFISKEIIILYIPTDRQADKGGLLYADSESIDPKLVFSFFLFF